MATKKTKTFIDGHGDAHITEPVVTRGSHSIRTEYPDGRVEFETIWEELVNDVNAALREYANNKTKEPTKKVQKAVKEVVEKITKPSKKSSATKTKATTTKTKKAK